LAFGRKSTTYSAPRYSSVCPRWRPKPLTSLTVMPCTPTSFRAFRTSSSRNGLMIAVTSFIRGSCAGKTAVFYTKGAVLCAGPDAVSEHHGAAVHHDRLPGDEPALVTGEKQHRAHDVLRGKPAADGLLGHRDRKRLVQLFGEYLVRCVGIDDVRRHRVHADRMTAELARQAARRTDDGGLRGGVMQPVRHAVGRRERADVHDRAGLLLFHRRHDRTA